MTEEQLKVIEKEMLFIKEPVVGGNIHYRLDRQEDHFLAFNHLNKRREKFAQPIVNPLPFAEGQLPVKLEYVEGHQIHRDNLLWKDKKYVIPMTLFRSFFAVSSEISTDILDFLRLSSRVKLEMMPREVEEIETLHVFKQFFTKHQKLTTIFTPIPLKNKALNI